MCFYQGASSTPPNTDIIPESQIQRLLEYEQDYKDDIFTKLSDYISIQLYTQQKCEICTNFFKCPKEFYVAPEPVNLTNWVQPDLSIIDRITEQDLNMFTDSLTPSSKQIYNHDLNITIDDGFENLDFSRLECELRDKYVLTPKETDCQDIKTEKSFAYELPHSFCKVLGALNVTNVKASEEISTSVQPIQTKKPSNYNEILNFFKLTTISDFFINEKEEIKVDLDETLICTPPKVNTLKFTYPSPDLFESSPDMFESPVKALKSDSVSPILSSYSNTKRLKLKSKRLFNDSINSNESLSLDETIIKKPNLNNLKLPHKSFIEPRNSPVLKNDDLRLHKRAPIEISDICDLSQLGLKSIFVNDKSKLPENGIKCDKPPVDNSFKNVSLDISDVCDLSVFGIGKETAKVLPDKKISNSQITSISKPIDNFLKTEENVSKSKSSSELKCSDVIDICDFFQVNQRNNITKNNTQSKAKKDISKPIDYLKIEKKVTKKNSSSELKCSDVLNICDLNQHGNSITHKETKTNRKDGSSQKAQKGIDRLQEFSDFCDISSFFEDNKNQNVIRKKAPQNIRSLIDHTDSDFELSPEKCPQIKKRKIQQREMLTDSEKTPTNSQKNNNLDQSRDGTYRKTRIHTIRNRGNGVLHLKQNLFSPKLNSTQRKSENSTPKAKRKNFNIPLPLDSDDEFEETVKSPIFSRKKGASKIVESTNRVKTSCTKTQKKTKKGCEFIINEAELSGSIVVSSDEDSFDDSFERSFVADETEDFVSTQMHVHYIKSAK